MSKILGQDFLSFVFKGTAKLVIMIIVTMIRKTTKVYQNYDDAFSIIYLDFQKAFDTVCHLALLRKFNIQEEAGPLCIRN